MPTNPEHQPAHSYREVLRERMRDPTPDQFPGAQFSWRRMALLAGLTGLLVGVAGMCSVTAGVLMLYFSSVGLFLVGKVVKRAGIECHILGWLTMALALAFHDSIKF